MSHRLRRGSWYAVPKGGAFPTGEGRLYSFPLAPWGSCEGFIIRGAFYIFQASTFTEILHCVQNDGSSRKMGCMP